MKEATGELNMTVITLIAVAAIGAVFYLVIWPIVQRTLVNQTCRSLGDGWHAVERTEGTLGDSSNAEVNDWVCCPAGVNTFDAATCTAP